MIKLENISFDHCIKCTVCTVYCPVARATHLFPGPKQSGPDAERLRIKNPELVDSSLKYCTNCKRCEIECPSDVKIAGLIHDAKWKYLKKGFFRPRDFFMSHTDLAGGMGVIFAPVLNFFLSLFPVKFFMDIFLRIPHRKTLPRYENSKFSSRFKKKIRKSQESYDRKVTYFHGCFVNYNNHQLGLDLVKVMNSMGFGVDITDEKCCGVPLIANGYLEKAAKNAKFNVSSLSKHREQHNGKIVSTSSSCSLALRYEYPHFLDVDNSAIYNHIEYITKFISVQFDAGNKPAMKPVNMRVAYHSPCHLERMGGVIYSTGLLKSIPGLELVILHSDCCGIAGTYGFKNENFRISQDVGKQLFKSIEKANPEYVVTDCETCAMQIEMNTDYKVLHPVSLLAMAVSETE